MTTTMRNAMKLGSTVFGMLLVAHTAAAQFTQQGPKLVGTASGNAWQGLSVALSADGNTAIVGGPNDDGNGAAWVWTRTGVNWTQQGTKLVGSGNVGDAAQGSSVALSADGNTAIVGGNQDNGGIGAAWVWTRSGVNWTQQGTKLVGSVYVGTSFQGWSVSLSGDGNTAIVGGNGDNGGAGAAWVWTRTGVNWTQQGTKLVGSGASADAQQGWSVALSGDGNTAIVGGYLDNSSAGAAWVWTWTGVVWSPQGSKLVASGEVGNASQGYSVSLSTDGSTAIIGGIASDAGFGAAWVWTRSLGVWTQGPKLVGSGAIGTFGASQGWSVSLSGDGKTAFVGGPDDHGGIGAAWVWTKSGVVWSPLGTKLVGSGYAGPSNQGRSVSLSGDGNTAIVGGYGDNGLIGAAWVFVYSAPVSATQLAFVQQPTNTAAGQAISPAVTVQLQDAGSSPVLQAGVSIVLALASGTGALSGTATQTTNASGLATFPGLSVNLIGTKTLSASSAGLTGATSGSFVISAGAAAALAISGGNSQHATVSTAFATPLQVTVMDSLGNPVSGASVTFTPPGSGASAAITGSPATTNASGIASVTATANGTAGGYNVVASAGTLPPVNFALTNDPALAASSSVPALGTAGLVLLGLALATLGAAALRQITP